MNSCWGKNYNGKNGEKSEIKGGMIEVHNIYPCYLKESCFSLEELPLDTPPPFSVDLPGGVPWM